ncbi:hypothetical protein [Ciceribacter sp. L1K22]|uniref:hypothetical protein n=1 Tax=Ciceribacter sp. L1K22 TaxID=2820275 RepID=UPI001ABE6F1B|nr:hypothetical protein [Ciceribacter sp. L1K22]MBO3759304.1 hypothetical protein [Ciceribacter sp. L1K22]
MANVRFELKQIPDGMRPLTSEEAEFTEVNISKYLSFTPMGDHLVPDRSILAPLQGVPARVLGGSLGIGGEHKGRWTEKEFDEFFEEHLSGGCYLWVESVEKEQTFEPLCWAPYSSARRDWLYVYAKIENSGLPCGMTSSDGRLSMFTELDCNFTIVYGDPTLISKFDEKFGEKYEICEYFKEFLKANEVDFGEGNIYQFLMTHLVPILGCDE